MRILASFVTVLILQGCATVDKPRHVDYDPDMDSPFICGMYACPRHHN